MSTFPVPPWCRCGRWWTATWPSKSACSSAMAWSAFLWCRDTMSRRLARWCRIRDGHADGVGALPRGILQVFVKGGGERTPEDIVPYRSNPLCTLGHIGRKLFRALQLSLSADLISDHAADRGAADRTDRAAAG